MDFAAIFVAVMAAASSAADAVAVFVRSSPSDTKPPAVGGDDDTPVHGAAGLRRSAHHGTHNNNAIDSSRQHVGRSSALPAGAKPRAGSVSVLNRVVGAVIALLVVGALYFEVHSTASELGRVVWNSPSGSLTNPAKIIALCGEVKRVADGHLGSVTMLIMIVYLLLQTFCIPGTIALNVVAGALLGVRVGLPLCVVLGTIGAVSCYSLSAIAGMRLVTAVDQRLMRGEGIGKLRASVNKYRSDLFVYLLFLRLTPFLPNWLINLGSPVVSVPLAHFAGATFLGIAPQTYLSVRFGTVAQAGSIKSIVTVYDTIAVACIGVLVLVASRLRKRFSGTGPAAASGPVDTRLAD